MLAVCFKEDFKTLNISIVNIYCERSIFTIITATWRPNIAGQLETHVLKSMLEILTTYMETRLYNSTDSLHFVPKGTGKRTCMI